MGRHSRRGPAPKSAPGGSDAGAARMPASPPPTEPTAPGTGTRRGAPVPPARTPGAATGGAPGPYGYGAPGHATGQWQPQHHFTDGTPAHGVPRASGGFPGGAPAQDAPRAQGRGFSEGAPAQGVPRFPDGTPARGVPRVPGGGFPEGAPAQGVPRFPDGTPAHGVPRLPDGTPARGVPRVPGGPSAPGGPQVRGGHPEQYENGGGWGELRPEGAGAAGTRPTRGPGLPRQRQAPPEAFHPQSQGPRQEYLDAFEADAADDVFAPPRTRRPAPGREPYDTGRSAFPAGPAGPAGPRDPDADDAPPTGEPAPARGGKGRTFTGIAAAAVTTVLAVVVAGQVSGAQDEAARSSAATDQARDARDTASRDDSRPSPSATPGRPVTLTYDQKMARTYPLSADLKGSGRFTTVPGTDKAPGKGQKYTYRVDVEQGLGLDGALFAEAVQKTLNDERSWAHGGKLTFERVDSGDPDFVITLASPGTTAVWCAKSGLDTTEDNVSCDSASTERVMINAYRWAQGSPTFGDRIYAYRQMLINHEVGHRLGHGHVTCDRNGEPAPVMQQQTKFLDHDGIHCLPNAWPYPEK
ncbi:DUF3152 domain-containing protein [Streptomyces sp. NPDC057386]|uniref:DUF3152 domain-containing protein n=1 Tax=unclassified Streptomyces TaxID=2593676 RepID=UPI00363352DF